MKKLIPYLSVSVLILAMFSFMNLSYAQQTKTEEASTPAEVTKANTYHSINFDFGYDFLAKYKKLDIPSVFESLDERNLDSMKSSDESAKYMSLKLSMNFFTEMFRFGFGLGFILPHDYDNQLERPATLERNTALVKGEQEFNFGINLQLIQFGYRIDLDPVELIPYIGLNVLYLKATVTASYQLDEEESSNGGDIELHKVLIPIYAGLDVIFAHAGPMSFYTGLELGYAIKVVYKNDSDDIGDTFADAIADESDPLTGLMGKITIGTAFNF